jgi:hypothetical protein
LKWFKHYTNAHKGEVFQTLSSEFGKVKVYGWYFLLVEYFTDMWDGTSDPTFKITVRVLSEFLEVKPKVLLRFLEHLKNADRIKLEQNENILIITLPKLLEIRHRDAIPSGQRPARVRPKSGQEENRREKSIYTPSEDQLRWYKELSALYTTTFSNTTIGEKAEQRFLEQVKTKSDYEDLRKSISNYKAAIDYDNRDREWRKSKRSFETYLGTKSSGFHWRQFINALENVGPKLKVLEL